LSQLKLIQRYLRYYYQSDTLYQIHSPFVYSFAEHVLEDDREFYVFQSAEKHRQLLLQNNTKIQLTDYGAGSHSGSNKSKTIKSIAKNAASQKWQCQTLFRLVNFLKPKTMLEMGTSLGISTIYQSQAAMNAQFITLEGDPQIAELSRMYFEDFNLKNVELIEGEFGSTLQSSLQKLKQLDYVFIDGNHRLTPTLQYFETCLKFAHGDSVFIFDDIHWSEEMEEAWEQVKKHPQVKISIDLFYMGIVFLRKGQREKENFILSPLSWKPWASLRAF